MSAQGLILLKPTSINYVDGSATLTANGSVTFSSCRSVSFNGVFSADYDTYLFVCHNTGGAQGWQQQLQLRAGGVDATSSVYTWQQNLVWGAAMASSRASNTPAFERWGSGGISCGIYGYLYGPYLADETAIRTVMNPQADGVTEPYIYDQAGTHDISSSYDGFTWLQQNYVSGRPSGRIAVYGLRK